MHGLELQQVHRILLFALVLELQSRGGGVRWWGVKWWGAEGRRGPLPTYGLERDPSIPYPAHIAQDLLGDQLSRARLSLLPVSLELEILLSPP